MYPNTLNKCLHSCSHHHKWGLHWSQSSKRGALSISQSTLTGRAVGPTSPQISSETPKLWWHAPNHDWVWWQRIKKRILPHNTPWQWHVAQGVNTRKGPMYTHGPGEGRSYLQPPGNHLPTGIHHQAVNCLPIGIQSPGKCLHTGIHSQVCNIPKQAATNPQ